ncbi:hypothetical protein ACP70R_014689 [Stipagrostis hirtigluma subsp. patula]
MTPSSATPRRASRARRRRRRNAAAAWGRGTPLAGATARTLAAGLWRTRQAQRMQAAGPGPAAAAARRNRQESSSAASLHDQARRRANHHLNKRRTDQFFGVGSQCQCRKNDYGILDKMEACVELYGSASSSSVEEKERATKWDRVYLNHLDNIFCSHRHRQWQPPRDVQRLEAELDMARAHIAELEEERRVTRKRLERFLRKLGEEKAAWKSRVRDKAERAAAAAREEARLERAHRRQLEAANAELMREVAEARLSAKQQAQSYEMERKARELMEEACSELTREVEEDQAEVELLRRECLRMREEMEEERRMLQMAEVWREERVQMKLSDAKLALEHKYAHLNRLQAEMEAFLRNKDGKDTSAMREARVLGEAAAAAATATSSSARSRRDHGGLAGSRRQTVDVDAVFEHFRRKESRQSPAPSSNYVESESPATDLFLAKAAGDDDDDDGDPYSDGSVDDDGGRDSCSWVGTSDPSVSAARASDASLPNNNGGGLDGSGVTETHSSAGTGASRRSKNTALIRRLWRSAIAESRKRTGSAVVNGVGWSPSSDRSSAVAAAPPTAPEAAAQCSSSGSVSIPRRRDAKAKAGHDGSPLSQRRGTPRSKQSLKEKLMEARMDDHNDKPSNSNAAKQKP